MRAILALAGLLASLAGAAETWTNPFGMRFVRIPANEFVMGNSDPDETLFELPDADRAQIADELPAHRVRIRRDFWLGETEVTQGQWRAVMKTRPGPKEHWQRADWERLPVVSVSWHDAQRFVAALNRSGVGRYRLPTEAEWEYAARAASEGSRPFPRSALDAHAWTLENSGDLLHPVATRRPNAWGLYDMLGNAWAWVADRYGAAYYGRSPFVDPAGPAQGGQRVRRGGSYHCQPHLVRVNYRAADAPGAGYSVLGFRIARDPDGSKPGGQ